MSVSGISSNFINQNIASIQSQQQRVQQDFQSLAQEFQSANVSAAQTGTQTAALQNSGLPSPANVPAPQTATSTQAPVQNNHVHWHHHMHPQPGNDTDTDSGQSTTAPSFGQLGQSIQSGNTSTPQQAYSSLQQELQQVALNSDLLTAQSAALQASDLSVTA